MNIIALALEDEGFRFLALRSALRSAASAAEVLQLVAERLPAALERERARIARYAHAGPYVSSPQDYGRRPY